MIQRMILRRRHDSGKPVPRRLRFRRRPPAPRDGFTLVEIMVSVVLLGVGITAVLYGMGVSHNTANEGRWVLVSGDLASYVKQYSKSLSFSEPGTGESNFGPETGETGFDDYDDIDDLDGIVLSPPILADGSELPDFVGWSQHVTVTVLDPDTLVEVPPYEDATIKRMEVEIYIGSRRVGLYQWIMTDR
jgi:prepilin-type N-terminal cleavage/methylation domain-containing protein